MLTLLAWLILVGPIDPPAWLLQRESVWRAVEAMAKQQEVWAKNDGVNSYGCGPGDPCPIRRDWAVWYWRYRLSYTREWPYLCDLRYFTLIDHQSCKAIVASLQKQQEEIGARQARISECQQALRLWAEHVELTEEQRSQQSRWQVAQAELQAELERLWRHTGAWSNLADALNPENNIPYRRASLNLLREQIGWANYYSGRIWPAEPAVKTTP